MTVGGLLAEIHPATARPRRRPRRRRRVAGRRTGSARPTGEMLEEVVLPPMESVVEGAVVEWRKALGDEIAADEILLEVSTDKVDIEVPSPAAGRRQDLVRRGETFQVRPPRRRRRGRDDGAAPAPKPADGQSAATAAGRRARRATLRRHGNAPRPPRRGRGGRPGGVKGSGPGGKIRRGGVNGSGGAAGRPDRRRAPRRGQLQGARPRCSPRRWTRAATIPTATSFRTLPSHARREAQGAQRGAQGGPRMKVSFTHLVAWAIVKAVEDGR